MKTGKQLSKYYIYSIIWANKIIAEVEGYSIDKAYAISPLFGSMVERQIADYQAQLDRLKYTAMVFGVFDECKSMFDKFYETNKKDVNYLLTHPKDMAAEVKYTLDSYDPDDDWEEWEDENFIQAIKFNKLWDNKMAYIMEQIGNISLEKTQWLPSCYANIFKEQHQIVYDLVKNISDYNNNLLWDLEWDRLNTAYTVGASDEDEAAMYEAQQEELEDFYSKQKQEYLKIQDKNIADYHNNMQLLEKIRREDFYD